MKNKIKKVFIGLHDIAFQIQDLQYGFNKNNIETITAVHKNRSNLDYDFVLYNETTNSKPNKIENLNNILHYKYNRYKLLKHAVKYCDLFVFMWATFYPDYRDIEYLHKKNKKIVNIFVGSDVRWKGAMEQEFDTYPNMFHIEYENYAEDIETLNRKLLFLRTAEKYSDIIYSIPNQAQIALKPYNLFRYPIVINDFNENSFQKQIPKVIHAPSLSFFKGTKYVLDVINKIQRYNKNFSFELIQDLPYEEVKKKYTEADILVGQLLCPGGGKQEREALASGTIVMSNMNEVYDQKTPDKCPIIDVNPETLEVKLNDVISNWEFRKEHAVKGRPWVEDNYDVSIFVKRILADLKNDKNDYDFYPTFYRNKYKPLNIREIDLLNKWNKIVKECAWYKDFIPSGKREGIIF
ncbi:MAG: hypothetical protein K9J13_16910 [Saprospiraceae bacterium]|nr:hypothetical protein [Saprospiraceae bacterium]